MRILELIDKTSKKGTPYKIAKTEAGDAFVFDPDLLQVVAVGEMSVRIENQKGKDGKSRAILVRDDGDREVKNPSRALEAYKLAFQCYLRNDRASMGEVPAIAAEVLQQIKEFVG